MAGVLGRRNDNPVAEVMQLLSIVEAGVAPIERFHPNEWNPNRMDERTYEAEKASIRQYGFIDPITVRPHPTTEGEWEILDGEHRWKAAQDEGLPDVSYNSVGPMADERAKLITITFNETRGNPDTVVLARLLLELEQAMEGDDGWSSTLPFTDAELKNYLEIGQLDWDADYGTSSDGEGGSEGQEEARHKVLLAYTEEQFERFQTFSRMVTHERQTDLNAAVLYGLEIAAREASPEGGEDA